MCIYIYIFINIYMRSQPLAAPTATDFPCNPCPLQQAVKCHEKTHTEKDPFQGPPVRENISLLPRTPDWPTDQRYSVAA